jgi:hypothetical protein
MISLKEIAMSATFPLEDSSAAGFPAAAHSQSDRIELWPLLQEVWGDVMALAMERGVGVRFHLQQGDGCMATLYGSQARLSRMFQECLASAIRATPQGATLDIEHHQAGPRALVVFRGCRLFERTVDAASADGTAARLVRQIISEHGGQLHEEHDGDAVDGLIELPTGAPFHADTAELDVAQAQHFAKDLAALVARARNRRAAADNAVSPSPARG